MEWMILPLRKYAQFSGRSRPKEFWMFVLFLILANIVLNIIEGALGLGVTDRYAYSNNMGAAAGSAHQSGPLVALFSLATLIPSLAVGVRRLHDTDRSGWWMLLAFFPFLSVSLLFSATMFGGLRGLFALVIPIAIVNLAVFIVLLVFMIQSGTRGPNRFGPDPLETGEGPVS